MARNNLSSFVSRSRRTPFWLPVVLACFLVQTLIPSGYMPGNLSSGEGALVFCGDTAFLDPNEPDISALLDDSARQNYGKAHLASTHHSLTHAPPLSYGPLSHAPLSHAPLSHDTDTSGISHCLFAYSSQLGQSAPAFALTFRQFADSYHRFPEQTASALSEPDHIRPLLRAPPYLSS